MFGLAAVKYSVNSDPSYYFTLSNSGSSINCNYHGDHTVMYDYWYSYAYFLYFTCSNPAFPTFNSSDRQCYPPLYSCNVSYYYDVINRTCLSCRFDCLTCSNSYQCTSCNNTYRYLSNYSCLPQTGYYESNATEPFLCDNTSCRGCENSSTTCTSCKLYVRWLDNNICRWCNHSFEGCITCNTTNCFSCLAGYRLTNSTYCNLPCDDVKCYICSNANTSVCLQCRYDFEMD
jgi:hypothetical protein